MNKTCSVTGHRDIYDAKILFVEDELRREIALAISEGFIHFISGFARGIDLLFTKLVLEAKNENEQISLEAAIPYKGRLKTNDSQFQILIGKCSTISIHSETYRKDCYMKRNQYMVQKSQRVIAVYDGRKTGGTYATICYAKKLQREIHTIII